MKSSGRMALQYGLIFAANGVSLPFAGLWFKAQGLSGAEIGVLMAAPMLGRVLTGPGIAIWADGFRHRRTPIALLAVISTLAYAGTGLASGFASWAALWFVATTASGAMIPLSDVLTLRLARREGFGFSFPRGCGSAAFVGANILMGAMLVRLPVDVVLIWVVAIGAMTSLVAFRFLPPEPVLEGAVSGGWSRFADMGRLMGDRTFVLALLAVGMIQATHGFYYAFSAISWKAQGISEGLTGLLWAFSVVVEIVFMWVIEPWRRRRGIGAWSLLVVGGIAGVVRWSALAMAPGLVWLWPLQALHALTFAATYLAGVQIIEILALPGSQTTAQTLSSVLSSGILIGGATLAAGPLYDAFGVGGYWAMTSMATTGLVVALILRRLMSITGPSEVPVSQR